MVRLGERIGPFEGRIDHELVRRYLAATNDPALEDERTSVPPVALVTQIWEAQTGGREALVPTELQEAATGGVHGEHDLVLHRPIVPGEPLRTWVDGHGARPAGRHSRVTLRYTTVDADDHLVAEQWWTTVFLGVTCEPVGESRPSPAVPEGDVGLVGTYAVTVDEDMPRRYAEVSGDWSPHHFDVEAAQRAGADRPFLHGLCTMALCAQGVVQLVADGDAERLRRVAVRFARPMPVGDELQLRVHHVGSGAFAFEASSGGVTVISNGFAELRGSGSSTAVPGPATTREALR